MEQKKSKHKEKGNKILLPKSYIGQKPLKIKHVKSRSLTENDLKLNKLDNDIDDNPYRCKSERKRKKVSFNNKIQIVNIHKYKDDNRLLYFGDNEDIEEKDIKKENKCFSCEVF